LSSTASAVIWKGSITRKESFHERRACIDISNNSQSCV
jgi:hypothetical protein